MGGGYDEEDVVEMEIEHGDGDGDGTVAVEDGSRALDDGENLVMISVQILVA